MAKNRFYAKNNVYHRKDKRKKTLKFRSKQIISLNNKENINKKICVCVTYDNIHECKYTHI